MYIGSFAGRLIVQVDPEIDYTATQNVRIVVKQQDTILNSQLVAGIDHVTGKEFDLSYAYLNFVDNIVMIIETVNPGQQFNKDNSVQLTQLKIDDLFTVVKLQHKGVLHDSSNNIVDVGNILWGNGQLRYTFELPIIKEILF